LSITLLRCFVRELGCKPYCAAITRAIVQLGSSLGVITTVEGVETEEQFDILRADGCMQLQGFLFSTPVPGAEILLLRGQLRPDIRAA